MLAFSSRNGGKSYTYVIAEDSVVLAELALVGHIAGES
jgi:hypothetical protein